MVLSTCHTVWKNEKFTVAPKKFRQIDSLVFSLVKTLLSRNFCQKSATVNFRNFHTVPTYQRPLLDFWHGMEQKQRKTIVRYFDTAKSKHKIELVKNWNFDFILSLTFSQMDLQTAIGNRKTCAFCVERFRCLLRNFP